MNWYPKDTYSYGWCGSIYKNDKSGKLRPITNPIYQMVLSEVHCQHWYEYQDDSLYILFSNILLGFHESIITVRIMNPCNTWDLLSEPIYKTVSYENFVNVKSLMCNIRKERL